jgi:hypothetical protein
MLAHNLGKKVELLMLVQIVNQTLSQSAPASVILAVKSVAKIFAREMIEGARKSRSTRSDYDTGNRRRSFLCLKF